MTSIVDLLDLREAAEAAARSNYANVTRNDPDAPAYDTIPVAPRRAMEATMLPLVCAAAIPIAATAYNLGLAAAERDAFEVIVNPNHVPANPFDESTNPFMQVI